MKAKQHLERLCSDRRQERTHRQDRYRNRDQQPVRAAHSERHHLLQLCHPVPAGFEVRGERRREGAGLDQENVAGSLAPHPPERPLHFSGRWKTYRPGCGHGGARSSVTESSAVWAYNPLNFRPRNFPKLRAALEGKCRAWSARSIDRAHRKRNTWFILLIHGLPQPLQ
jgi:hypothetical protein